MWAKGHKISHEGVAGVLEAAVEHREKSSPLVSIPSARARKVSATAPVNATVQKRFRSFDRSDEARPAKAPVLMKPEASMSILNWIGGHSLNFLDKLNWSPHQTPNSTSDCQVNPASPTSISVANATINSLDLNASATLSVGSTDTFTILGAPDSSNATGASTNSGTLALGSACDLFLDGLFTNAGALNTASASDVWVNSSFSNRGAVNQSGDFTVGQTHAGAVTNSATWSITGAHDIAKGVAGGSFTNEGTLTRTGAGVSDVGVATANSGAVSVNQGKLEFSATVANTGTMTATGSVLELDKAVSGVGALDIGAGGVMNIIRGKDAGQTVDYLGTGELEFHTPGTFAGHISGFGGADLIDLLSTPATSASFSSGVLTVLDGSTAVAHLNFNGSYSTSSFSLASDLHGGTLIKFV
jgi:hypothetical protein